MPGALETFHDQQLRLIVHTSVGGSQVRIRVSNLYGTDPLHLEAAHAGAVQLHFRGAPSVNIAPGATVTSDAALLELPPLADLAVTLRLSGTVQAATSHLLALQTSSVSAPGAAPDGPFVAAANITTWPFLVGVDVVAAVPGTRAVVVFGDSTVDGDGSTAGENRRWPDYLARNLNATGSGAGVLNLGIIGNRLLHDSPGNADFGAALGEAGIRRFQRDVLNQPGVATVIVRLGVNDLGFPGTVEPHAPAVDARQLLAGYEQLAARAHQRGVRIFVTTITPFGGTQLFEGFHTPAKERVREQVNAALRASKAFDGVIDADAVLRDPAQPSKLLAAYDSGDHLHPNDAGSARLAAAMPADLTTR